jgi:hypothetical protein
VREESKAMILGLTAAATARFYAASKIKTSHYNQKHIKPSLIQHRNTQEEG